MSGKSTKSPKNVENFKQDLTVAVKDLSIFDDGFALLRQQFINEMKRIEKEMVKFSGYLTQLNENKHNGTPTPSKTDVEVWNCLTNSPLINGEGENKTLKLQFDVSQFEPNEVQVRVLNDLLVVSASHEEKTDNAIVYRQYNREFLLPPGTNPDDIQPSLTKDGVLLVEAPFPNLAIEFDASTLEK